MCALKSRGVPRCGPLISYDASNRSSVKLNGGRSSGLKSVPGLKSSYWVSVFEKPVPRRTSLPPSDLKYWPQAKATSITISETWKIRFPASRR